MPWKSTGWVNNRNVTQLAEFMVLRGEVAVAGRSGGDRLWDLATRVYPDDPVVPAAARPCCPPSAGSFTTASAPSISSSSTAIHQDVPFTPAMTAAIGREIDDLAHWLDLDPALK